VTAGGQAVREATVSFGGRRDTTDSHGRARICVTPKRRGKLTAKASKPGAKGVRVAIAVRR
jgi:hypothetical protein